MTNPDDLEAVSTLNAFMNLRLGDKAGDIELVPPEYRIGGSGMTVIKAAFTHLKPNGSRFSNGTYGVFLLCRERNGNGYSLDQTPQRAVPERDDPAAGLPQ